MELALSVALGVGLAAACGFRVFVPFTIISMAALSGYLHLSPDFAWIGTYPALLAFSTATVLEIMAYYVPWLDHLLDVIAAPAAVVAGMIATASVVTGMSPMLQWSTAIIAGGGVAAVFQASTTVLRGVSTMTTGGIGNFFVATGELIGSIMLSLLALALPWLVLVLILLFIIFVIRKITQRNTVLKQPT
ncbi:MAG: DUF4126 domain-containing protein [Caldilineaceae bacterium]